MWCARSLRSPDGRNLKLRSPSLLRTYRYWPEPGTRHKCTPLRGPATHTVTTTLLPAYAPSHCVCVGSRRALAPQVENCQGPSGLGAGREEKVKEYLPRLGMVS